ncbi:MAG: phosphate/phosphite/phosphonate ABC transporter substrate-binding protein [Chloroflexi bacterium]|nr:phosphate/phosphite/phosphonate ABC transporter substrate-binding protein [Chloroflexota bacterium]
MSIVLNKCYRLAGIIFVILLLLALGACAEGQPNKRIRLSAVEPGLSNAPGQPGRLPLRVAIAGVISPKETLRTYNELLAYLGQRLGRPVQLLQRSTYAEINDLVRSGNVDLAFICSQAYVEGNQDFGMELLVAPQVRGQAVYYSYVIVPYDSPAQSLADLRGKTFAFTDPMSNSGRLSPTYMLLQMGETPESFFKKYIFTYSHDNSIVAVAEKLVDGAAVDSLVYDYTLARDPRYSARTRVIAKSPPYGSPPVVVHPALNAQLKAQLRELFLSMHESERGQQILQGLLIDRFVIPDEHAYDTVRMMLMKVRRQGESR